MMRRLLDDVMTIQMCENIVGAPTEVESNERASVATDKDPTLSGAWDDEDEDEDDLDLEEKAAAAGVGAGRILAPGVKSQSRSGPKQGTSTGKGSGGRSALGQMSQNAGRGADGGGGGGGNCAKGGQSTRPPTIKEIAENIGNSPGVLDELMEAEANPQLAQMAMLAQMMGIDLGSIMGTGSGDCSYDDFD